MHGAVVVDAQLCTGLGLDAFDVFAARSNEFADAIRWDLHGNDAWSVWAEFGWAADGFFHLVDDLEAAVFRDFDAFFKDRKRDAGQLEVELIAGNTSAGAAEFEVHVAVEVLAADDVEQSCIGFHVAVFIEVCHQTTRNAADGSLERHTSVEQGHHTGTNGCHRSGPVRLGHFGGNTHGVWEYGLGWDDGSDRALGKSTVTDLAAVESTHTTRFTHGEGWEVVVQDETFFGFAARVVVHVLLLVRRGEGRNGKGLGFATGEDGGAVNARKGCHFAVERAQVTDFAAISAHTFFHDGDAESFLLKVFEGLLDFKLGGLWEALHDGGFHFIAQGTDFFATLYFGSSVDGGLDAAACDFVGDFQEFVFGHSHGVFALGFASLGDEFFLGGNDFLHGCLGEME